MARLKLVLAFFSLVVLAGGAYAVAYYWKNYFRPNWEVTREFEGVGGKKESKKKELPDLGLRQFDTAKALLIDGQMQAAKDQLHYVLDYFPDSKAAPEAKRILGEINLDVLLSRAPMPGKEEHVIKNGDLLAPLSRKYQTSYNYMMRASGRTNHLIHPGERLVVYPLNFKLRISLKDETITVLTPDEDKFFKEYAIRAVKLPSSLRPPASAKIAEMPAFYDGKPVNFESSHYFEAKKWIRTSQAGLFIRPYQGKSSGQKKGDDSSSSQESGILVDRSDLEEMFAYLRPSNLITLVP